MKTIRKIIFFIEFNYNKRFYNPHKKYRGFLEKDGKKIPATIWEYKPLGLLGKTKEESTKYYLEFLKNRNGYLSKAVRLRPCRRTNFILFRTIKLTANKLRNYILIVFKKFHLNIR